MTDTSGTARPRIFWAAALAVAALTIALLWYPFGFSMGGVVEEWGMITTLDAFPGFWSSFPGQPMANMFVARPLQITPFAIAHAISPHSFLGFHLELIVACVLRIFSGIVIGRFLFGRGIYAVLFGLLAFVFPADTQQLAFRTINISCSTALSIASAAALLMAMDEAHAGRRWTLVAVSIVTGLTGVLIYEPSITLYAIAPLLVLAREGFPETVRIVRRRAREVAVWLIAPIANAAYFVYAVVLLKSGYQVQSASGGMLAGVRQNFHYLIDSLAYRMVLDTWRSIGHIFTQIVHWPYVVAVGIITLAGFWMLSRVPRAPRNLAMLARLATAGVILSIVAYLPFMVAESHMLIAQRTMMAPAFGFVLVLVALIASVLNGDRAAPVFVSTVLVFSGFVAQLFQLDTYTRQYTDVIRPYMSQLADRSDRAKIQHLVFDRTGYADHLGGMYFSLVMDGPKVRLGSYAQRFLLCLSGSKPFYTESAVCEHDGSTWRVTPAYSGTDSMDESKVDVIRFGPDLDHAYRAHSGIWKDLGSYDVAKSIFYVRPDDLDSYECRPDTMWGYSNFCRGNGWSDGLYAKESWRNGIGYIAAGSSDPDFVFTMKPNGSDYALQIQTFGPALAQIVGNLTIDVNGHKVAFQLARPDLIEARVEASTLVSGTNIVTLHNATILGTPTGLAVVRVSVTPVTAPGNSSVAPSRTQ